jgi:RNA polymerase sigma-70 factor (ECF subfamily)
VVTQTDNQELETLLERCALGERDALRALYERTAPRLQGILMRILGSRPAAEDALQDAFIRIWQQAARFDPIRGRALSWMVAIARNRALDMKRAVRPMVLLEVAELAGAEQLVVEDPAGSSEFGSAGAALRRCLAELLAAQRQCLVLAYQKGLTQERIATTLGQPLGTVKSWMRRGLQSLARCMQP